MGSDMNLEFKKALEKRKILKFNKAKALVTKELEAAQDDLVEAEDRLKNGKFKYATGRKWGSAPDMGHFNGSK